MKRLLAAGATAIYQVTRSFRGGERGPLHNPEFTIVEWYRAGDDMQAGMELLDALAQSLLGTPPATRTTYADGISAAPWTQSAHGDARRIGRRGRRCRGCRARGHASRRPRRMAESFARHAHRAATRPRPAGNRVPLSGDAIGAGEDRSKRQRLWRSPSDSSCTTAASNWPTAITNLTDAAELRRRLEAVNAARVADGRRALPMPERLLAAMEHGLPALHRLRTGLRPAGDAGGGAESIDEVMTFQSIVV